MKTYSIYFCEDAIGRSLEQQEDVLFWRPDRTDLKLLSATLDMEVGKAGKFTFQMPYSHPYRKKIHKRRTRFYVARGNTPIWSGRVLDTEKTFYKAIKVTVEGALTYFLDTIQRPYDFDDILNLAIEKGNIFVPQSENPPTIIETKHLLYFLIYRHNKEADPDKNFLFDVHNDIIAYGDEDETKFNSDGVRKKYKSEEYSNTKDELNESIISKYGGFFFAEYDPDTHKNRIKYCLNESGIRYSSGKSQIIEFGKNMTDFSELISSENIYTRCIPLGATYDDFEKLRKQAYEAEKKEYNDAINDYNKKVGAKKQADKKEAERKKKAAENACGYTQYKIDLAEYRKQKYKFDLGQITTKPEKPTTVEPPKTDSGRTKTLKDYTLDDGTTYDPTKYQRIPAEEKMDSWEDTDWAMPKSVDGKTKVTVNTVINLWYKSPWKVTKKDGVDDIVVYNESDLTTFGAITNSVDFKVYLPKELPSTESKCKDVFNAYISDLRAKGIKYLRKNRKMSTTINVSAVDLAWYSNDKFDHIDCGYSIPIYSRPHGLGGEGVGLLCSANSLNLISPGESEYTIGATFKGISDKSVSNKEQSGKAYGLARENYSL